jgi:Xaa-Pro aminopeptidase
MATTRALTRLRTLMRDSSRFDGKTLLGYIVPSADAHGSEYICESDKRRQFISGFSGSAGTVVVTQDSALLWTGQW